MSTWQVEVLSTGIWNGDTFREADLEELAANFARLRAHVKVPLKFGHADEQTLLGQPDGDPALGWISALTVRDGKLLATFSHVPDVVTQAVRASLYRRVSSEVAYHVKWNGQDIGKVLVGVALLGADLPAVSNLADLGAYLTARGLTARRVYRFDNPGRGGASPRPAPSPRCDMTHATPLEAKPPGPPPAQANIQPPGANQPTAEGVESPALETPGIVAHLTRQLQDREAELECLRQQQTESQEMQRQARFAQARQGFLGTLNGLVRQGRLAPALRDKAALCIAGQARQFAGELVLGTDLVAELLAQASQPAPFPAGESAAAGSLKDLAALHGQSARAELEGEMGKLMGGGHFTLAQAQAHVLRHHPALAERWLEEINQPPSLER